MANAGERRVTSALGSGFDGGVPRLGDISVWHCFKLWTGASDPVLAGLCRGCCFAAVQNRST